MARACRPRSRTICSSRSALARPATRMRVAPVLASPYAVDWSMPSAAISAFATDARAVPFSGFDVPYRRLEISASPKADPQLDTDGEQRPLRTEQHCLLVDDDDVSRMVSADQIRRSGLQVIEADSVAAALAAAVAKPFDLYVIDYHLSDGDGATLASHLRRQPNRGEARYIALTANADLVTSADGGNQPFDLLLTKPISGAALAAAIYAADRPPTLQAPSPINAPQALQGVSPRIVDAMAAAFTVQWDDEVAKLQAALASGDRHRVADIAHKIASSCATIGIVDLAGMLKDLEVECRRRQGAPDLRAWRTPRRPCPPSCPRPGTGTGKGGGVMTPRRNAAALGAIFERQPSRVLVGGRRSGRTCAAARDAHCQGA